MKALIFLADALIVAGFFGALWLMLAVTPS